MTPTDDVTAVAQTIQLAVAPVFLLAGIGAVLNAIAGRLARVVDRVRQLEQVQPGSTGDEHARQTAELNILDSRIKLTTNAMFLCVASGLAVCALVAMMFIGTLTGADIGITVALLFVLSLSLLASGLIAFLLETRIAVRTLRVRDELLED